MEVVNMKRIIFTGAKLDNIINEYLVSKNTIAYIARKFNVEHRAIKRTLIENNVVLRKVGIDKIDIPGLLSDYVSGVSVNELAKRCRITGKDIKSLIIDNGVTIRTRSQAEKIKWSLMSDSARANQVKACHEAGKGREVTIQESMKRAKGRERAGYTNSIHEQRFFDLMANRNIALIPQTACNVYNIDFTIGTVAVEIHGGHWHSYGRHKTVFAKRTKKLIDSGYTVIILNVTATHPLSDSVADYMADLIQESRRNKPQFGKHRVVWGAGEYVTAFGLDSIDNALVSPFKQARDSTTGRYETIPC